MWDGRRMFDEYNNIDCVYAPSSTVRDHRILLTGFSVAHLISLVLSSVDSVNQTEHSWNINKSRNCRGHCPHPTTMSPSDSTCSTLLSWRNCNRCMNTFASVKLLAMPDQIPEILPLGVCLCNDEHDERITRFSECPGNYSITALCINSQIRRRSVYDDWNLKYRNPVCSNSFQISLTN